MKNFKKVISAVIALALSASTLVSAASFTDVAKTAPYAEAVEVLSSLKIVNGYEDGTFKPEGEITRAEAATMIVGALNMTAEAQNAAGSTQFSDVNEQAAWATGYINVGVAQKFINGMGDGTFAPKANVTYAQMCVMLTTIAGYGEYAAKDGYPTGYTTMAATTGINKGVSVGDNTALTRGQVAQMIYNALTTPMLGVDKYNFTGNEYAMLDGSNGKFKTLLSDKFDGYVATITIDQTPVANALPNGEFVFDITKADWWFDGEIASFPVNDVDGLYDANVDVNNFYKQTGKAVFVANEDEEPVLVYFAPTTKTVKKEFEADSYVLQSDLKDGVNRYDDNGGKIRFGTKYYAIESDAKIYVNGIEADNALVEADFDTYLGNAIGTITLIDTDSVNDGYDNIFVEIWQIAKVYGVDYDNGTTTITMQTVSTVGEDYEKIVITDEAVEDGDTVVSVEKAGEAVALTDIVKGDIIAYKSDITGTDVLTDPKTIDILVTNDTVSGKVTGVDPDEKTFLIDGTAYKMVGTWNASFVDVAKTYTLTLDPFGRLVEKKLDASADLYGIFVSADDDTVRIVLADGTSKKYVMESGAGAGAYATKNATQIETIINTAGNVYDRIVTYKVRNSTGEISYIAPASATATVNTAAWSTAVKYVGRTGRLDGLKISDTTAVIDASKALSDMDAAANYSKYTAEFKDGAGYECAIVSTGTYVNLVVIKQVGTKLNADSRFAIVKKAPVLELTDDGDYVEVVEVLLNGEVTKLTFEEDVYDNIFKVVDPTPTTSLAVGDAFYYEVNSYGHVDKVFRVVDVDNASPFTNLEDAIDAVTGLSAASFIELTAGEEGLWAFDLDNSTNRADVQLVEGFVIEAESEQIMFAAIDDPLTTVDTTKNLKDDTTGVVFYGATEDTAIYVYDEDADTEISAKSDASMIAPTGLAKYLDDGVYDVTNITPAGSDMAGDANYAVAMIVDGEVVAIYVIK